MSLFAPAVILSAFLLFLIQPLAGKQMLPLFGGSAAVWSACLLFFQFALLAGYLYAHAITRWLRPKHQAIFHGAVVLGCLAAPRAELSTGTGSLHLIYALTTTVGLRYLLLSATSPLLQHWHATLNPGGRSYRLSAWSNAACAVALLSFPLFWEARFGVRELERWWGWAFAAEAVLLMLAAAVVYRSGASNPPVGLISGTSWRMRAKWLAWPALASAFLMATSTHLCQIVAPAPLLWVVPLLVYLMSFVAVFEREWYKPSFGGVMGLTGLLMMAGAMLYLDLQAALLLKVTLYAGGLFVLCLFCHGELASVKPERERITSYWTHVAAGGALGSLAIGFASPMLLRGYFELPLLMAAAGALCFWRMRRLSRFVRQGAAIAAVLAATPALALVTGYYSGLVEAGRNFYGSLRILDEPARAGRPPLRKMLNGLVTHGTQFQTPEREMEPTTYYGRMSGAGLELSRTSGPRHVGVIGLGAGTLAAYGRTGDRFRFYEINPLVIEIARRDFSYLRRTQAAVEVVEGDARLTLAQEQPQQFDLLLVDAFSGDSIPAHLLTREAFTVYRRHLKADGVLALHVSNQFLDLEPEVRALAADAGLGCSRVANSAQPESGVFGAVWMLVRGPARTDSPASHFPVWTDDWSSVLAVLK